MLDLVLQHSRQRARRGEVRRPEVDLTYAAYGLFLNAFVSCPLDETTMPLTWIFQRSSIGSRAYTARLLHREPKRQASYLGIWFDSYLRIPTMI